MIVFFGVFQYVVDFFFFNFVDIISVGYVVNNDFEQYFNYYYCGMALIYDIMIGDMYIFFFGGMSQFYFDVEGELWEDQAVFFVFIIGWVMWYIDGSMIEQCVGELFVLLGVGLEFIFVDNMLDW